LGGCHRRAASAVERELASQLAPTVGRIERVRCEPSSPPSRCVVVAADQVEVPVRLGAQGDQLQWQVEGTLISARRLEQHLGAELESLGLPSAARCGPPLRAIAAVQRIECQLPALGLAWATVRSDGTFSLEIALGQAAAARTEAPDPASLDALSRALDREQGSDDASDGDDGDDGDDDDRARGAGDERGDQSDQPRRPPTSPAQRGAPTRAPATRAGVPRPREHS
jgi:hypothetical protein